MGLNISVKQAWFIAALLGIGFTFVFVILPHLRWVSEVSVGSQGAAVAESLGDEPVAEAFDVVGVPMATSIGLPFRLRIPTINTDAAVEFVGLTLEGTMDVPKDPGNVAWLQSGPRPGETGNAVIAGHFGWKNGKAAVFDKLSELRPGNEIFAEDEKGAVSTFVVRELRSYDKNDNASDIFNGEAGKTQLVLITCEGEWNKKEKSYSKRLVVFADLAQMVEPTPL